MKFLELVQPDIIPTIEGIAQPFPLYRYDKGPQRYYFQIPEVGEPIGYLSVTEFVSKSLGISQILADWIAKMGKEAAQQYASMRADYGTLMHIEITELLRTGKGNFADIADRTFKYAIEKGHAHMSDVWQSDIVRDIATFTVFAKEKNLKVIAAEIGIASDRYGVAGCIDLVCELDFNRKRVKALVDYKSGRKGFFESHELQLNVYKQIWNDQYFDVYPISHVFNWAPNDWRKTPTYKLQNQTKSKFANSVIQRLALAKSEGWIDPPTGHITVVGEFELETFDINNHLQNTKFLKNE